MSKRKDENTVTIQKNNFPEKLQEINREQGGILHHRMKTKMKKRL